MLESQARERFVASRRACAERLYRGEETPHRSCGIALAETFGCPTPAYQSLRKGGITGEGPCGAIQAGVLLLGELFGDPDPTGPVTPELREAVGRYRSAVGLKVQGPLETSCNQRTGDLGAFMGSERKGYCTNLAGDVAEAVAAVLWDLGHPLARASHCEPEPSQTAKR